MISCSSWCLNIRLCSYNLVFNEVPNNSGTTHQMNNVCSTTMCAPTMLSGNDHVGYSRKANVWETRVNNTKTRKVCANGNKFCPGKE